ncbi:MAG: hypothetical protein JWQ84_3266 [Mucilaginibacter sp.]|nr:hypothetical protein [Mucilaginibacter sp.]
MKTIFLFIISLFYIDSCFAQDTVEQKNRLSDSVIERFFVLKTDKKVKEGPYRALFKRKTIVATGYYRKNKKTGIWNFYKQDGSLVETYNYDTDEITFEAPVYTADDLNYHIDDTIKKADKVTRPLKIGGSYYGFIPYLNLFKLPFDTFGINTDSFNAYVELLISPLGRLADYKVHILSALYNYNYTFNLDVHLFDEADQKFVPATFNEKPVLSRIFIRCVVTDNGGLDFY